MMSYALEPLLLLLISFLLFDSFLCGKNLRFLIQLLRDKFTVAVDSSNDSHGTWMNERNLREIHLAMMWLNMWLAGSVITKLFDWALALEKNPTNHTYCWHLQFSVNIHIGLGSSGPMFWEGEGIILYDRSTSHCRSISNDTNQSLESYFQSQIK